jgi:hypothetical protein
LPSCSGGVCVSAFLVGGLERIRAGRGAAPVTPSPRTVNAKKHAEFQVMRSIPYFSTMSDEELREQRIPPGMHSWGEVTVMGKRLDGLNWLFLPPETGPARVDADGVHPLRF